MEPRLARIMGRREAIVLASLGLVGCAVPEVLSPTMDGQKTKFPEKTALSERDQILNEAGVFTSLIFNNPKHPRKSFRRVVPRSKRSSPKRSAG